MQDPEAQQPFLAQAAQERQGQHVCTLQWEGYVQPVRATTRSRKILQVTAWQGLPLQALQGLLYSPTRPEDKHSQEEEEASVVAGDCVVQTPVQQQRSQSRM